MLKKAGQHFKIVLGDNGLGKARSKEKEQQGEVKEILRIQIASKDPIIKKFFIIY